MRRCASAIAFALVTAIYCLVFGAIYVAAVALDALTLWCFGITQRFTDWFWVGD